jgi:EpsI family protein
VRATGIPVLRSGTRFELPTGSWSVVEACSGVRYLISSITLGSLYAYLTYRSTVRRMLFVGLSIVVPVIANGLRAYMIVMIGHLSGMELATGVDHIIYGWLFFGLVMFIMFWIGSFWREDIAAEAAPAQASVSASVAQAAGTPRRLPAMVAGVLLVCAFWPALALVGERANHNPAPVRLADIAVSAPQAADFADWKPFYMAPDARFHQAYQAGALPVSLTVLYYRNQNPEKNLISSLNRLSGYEDTWHEVEGTSRFETVAGTSVTLHEGILRTPQGAIMVWSFKWVGGHYTGSDYVGKLWQAANKAMMRGDDGAAVMLAVPYDNDKERARAALHRFLSDQGPALDQALKATRTH